MRITYVSSSITEIQIQLLNSLKKNGQDVLLLEYFSNRYQKATGYAFTPCIKYSSTSRFKGPVFYLARLRSIARFFLKNKTIGDSDVLHAHMLFGDGFICRLISEKQDIPYVVSVRNTDLNLWFLWKLPWLKKMGIKNLFEAKAIICLSNPYKKQLLERIPEGIRQIISEKCFVIPNGVDSFWFENEYNEKRSLKSKIRFITVGRIEENKNQLLVASAINEFRKRTSLLVEYIIIGNCTDSRMYDELCKYDFVTIKGHMKKESLIHELRCSDIFVLASHHETFGLVYVEAMTQGLPVIFTKGQGFDGQFKDKMVGVPVNSKDLMSIVNGIEHVVNDYSNLATNAANQCEVFMWEKVVQKLETAYSI